MTADRICIPRILARTSPFYSSAPRAALTAIRPRTRLPRDMPCPDDAARCACVFICARSSKLSSGPRSANIVPHSSGLYRWMTLPHCLCFCLSTLPLTCPSACDWTKQDEFCRRNSHAGTLKLTSALSQPAEMRSRSKEAIGRSEVCGYRYLRSCRVNVCVILHCCNPKPCSASPLTRSYLDQMINHSPEEHARIVQLSSIWNAKCRHSIAVESRIWPRAEGARTDA